MNDTALDKKTFSLEELAALTGTSRRTVRYYIQLGIVPRPDGSGRAASYSQRHLETLLRTKTLTDAGVALERVREVIAGDADSPVPPRWRTAGEVVVRSHIFAAAGVEVVIAPDELAATPEQVRDFARAVSNAAKQIFSAAGNRR